MSKGEGECETESAGVGDREPLLVREGRGDHEKVALPLYEELPLAEGVTEGEGDTSAVAVARATDGEGELVADSVREPRGESLTEAVAELVSEKNRDEPDREALPALLRETQPLPLAVAVGLSTPMLDVPQGEDEGEREPEDVTEGVKELDTDADGEPDR